jgi:hypothetical protein
MQTCLEKKGIEARGEALVRNDYSRIDEYSDLHSDALSNGDPQGKGTGIGGHTHSTPDSSRPSTIDYSNFDTMNGGGLYDIEGRNGVGGRNFLMNISVYNAQHEYGPNSVDTSANISDGQVRF